MPTQFPIFDPFGWFRAPLSGDVNQRISAPWFSPSLTVNYAGSPAIEERVVSDVASYGRQLGWLSELVAALAKGEPPPQTTLDQLEKAMAEIEKIKASVRGRAVDDANAALDRLGKEDPEGLNALLRDRLRRAS
jgi:hypothetical protein